MNRKERRRFASKQKWSQRAAIRAAIQELLEEGLIVPTGEMRPGPITGELRPVYVTREQAMAMGLLKKN